MNWILIMTILAFAIYLSYNMVAVHLFGVPSSLSETYYLYGSRKNWMKVFFPIMMVSMAGLLMPAWIDMSEGSPFQFLAFLAPAGIIFTGMAPAFKNGELEFKVHSTSAIFAAICSLLWVIFVAKLWYIVLIWLVGIVLASIFTKTFKKCKIYWLETVAFMSTFSSIIIYYICF